MLEVRGVQAHACVRTGKHGYPVVGVGCMRRDDGAASVRRGLPPSLDAASVPQLQPCEGPFSDSNAQTSQRPTVAAQRRAAGKRWMERQRARTAQQAAPTQWAPEPPRGEVHIAGHETAE